MGAFGAVLTDVPLKWGLGSFSKGAEAISCCEAGGCGLHCEWIETSEMGGYRTTTAACLPDELQPG